MKTIAAFRNEAPIRLPSGRRMLAPCAFTLVELLTVIAIIAILSGLLFPAIGAIKESNRRTQASVDVHRIVSAVQAFRTEYGKYPALPNTAGIDVAVGDSAVGLKIRNRELFYSLRSIDRGINSDFAVNFRKVVFLEGKNVADPEHPRSGFLTPAGSKNSAQEDCFFDPWGHEYCVAIDYSSDDKLKLAYADYSGENAPSIGVGAFSLGADGTLGANGNMSVVDGTIKADDVVSWR